MTTNLNCLSYWFPILESAGLPAPRTTILRMSAEAVKSAEDAMDGRGDAMEYGQFMMSLIAAADAMGYPCFLRTGQTADKHRWSETCFLSRHELVSPNVASLIEFSMMSDLPFDVWAVREMLPTVPLAICPRYKDMPVNLEWRFFVRDGDIICQHPYWPHKALVEGGITDINARLIGLVYGDWSVDVLWTDNGWYVTDCAEARQSWHWNGCENAGMFK